MGQLIAFPTQGHEPWIDKRQLAVHQGCSIRQVERLVEAGCPSRDPADSPSGKRQFKISAVETWLRERKAS